MALSMVAKFRVGSYRKIHAFRFMLKRCCTTDNVRLRFAPSPTGMLHLGGLRTALFNYLFAKSKGGKFILRIEDTDQKRSIPGAIEKLESMLDWLGITPDEGPSQGGDFGPYIQSQRYDLYQENVVELLKSGHCYMCFCTQRRLQLLKKDRASRGETSRYDNKCRGLDENEIERNLLTNMPYVIRFKYEPVNMEWHDLVYGDMEAGEDHEEGDFVVIKSDGYPSYHFANVVDDHHMKVSHVLRGQEWQVSTPKHLQMYNAFGWTPPQFGHLPLILNRDGTKLSKRQNDITVEHFKDEDFEPGAVLNYVTSTGSGFTESTAGKTLQEMVPLFSVDRISRHSGRLSDLNLAGLNMQHLQKQLEVDKASLIERVRDLLKTRYVDSLRDDVDQERILSDGYIESVLRWSLNEHRISHLQDLFNETLEFIWTLPSDEQLNSVLIPEIDCAKIIQEVREKLDFVDSAQFEQDSLKKILFSHCKANGIAANKYMRLLRMCIGGRKDGPSVAEMMALLGKDETMNRLKTAGEKLKSNDAAGEQLNSNV